MLEKYDQGNDIVLASVYAPGGRIIGVAPWRFVASRSVSNAFRYAGGLREVHTLSSLYRVYRAGTLRRAAETYGYLLVREPGFAANVELLLKLYNAGAKVAEVPTVNDWSRRLGRLEDASGSDGEGLREVDGRAPHRSHPASADLPTLDRTMSDQPRIAIVGAGILGTVLSLRLAEAGFGVTLLDRAPTAGGLAGAMDFGGHRVDRFYHVIVPSDERMIALAHELGLGEELSFSPVGVGFFVDGEMYPFNGVGDFLRFPPLSPPARARLAWFVAQCQLRGDYEPLEDVPLLRWLTRHCGSEVTKRIWRPLLDSRFDRTYDELPATYLWARTNRMRSARKGGGSETMGCLTGGHERLVEAVAARAQSSGVDIRLGAGVEGVTFDPDLGVTGVRVDGEEQRFDLTIPTLQPPALARLLPKPLHGLLDAYPSRFLGVVCLVLKTRESVLPYYSVNICDPDTDNDRRRDLSCRRHRAYGRVAAPVSAKVLRGHGAGVHRGRRVDLQAVHRDARAPGA